MADRANKYGYGRYVSMDQLRDEVVSRLLYIINYFVNNNKNYKPTPEASQFLKDSDIPNFSTKKGNPKENQLNLLVWGEPGLGKTTFIEYITDKLGIELYRVSAKHSGGDFEGIMMSSDSAALVKFAKNKLIPMIVEEPQIIDNKFKESGVFKKLIDKEDKNINNRRELLSAIENDKIYDFQILKIYNDINGTNLSLNDTYIKKPGFLPRINSDKPSLLMIDEINMTSTNVLAYLQQLLDYSSRSIRSQYIEDYYIPNTCLVYATGNKEKSSRESVKKVSDAFLGRVKSLTLYVPVDQWIKWGEQPSPKYEGEQMVHPYIIEFVEHYEKLGNGVYYSGKGDAEGKDSGRDLKRMSDSLYRVLDQYGYGTENFNKLSNEQKKKFELAIFLIADGAEGDDERNMDELNGKWEDFMREKLKNKFPDVNLFIKNPKNNPLPKDDSDTTTRQRSEFVNSYMDIMMNDMVDIIGEMGKNKTKDKNINNEDNNILSAYKRKANNAGKDNIEKNVDKDDEIIYNKNTSQNKKDKIIKLCGVLNKYIPSFSILVNTFTDVVNDAMYNEYTKYNYTFFRILSFIDSYAYTDDYIEEIYNKIDGILNKVAIEIPESSQKIEKESDKESNVVYAD